MIRLGEFQFQPNSVYGKNERDLNSSEAQVAETAAGMFYCLIHDLVFIHTV